MILGKISHKQANIKVKSKKLVLNIDPSHTRHLSGGEFHFVKRMPRAEERNT